MMTIDKDMKIKIGSFRQMADAEHAMCQSRLRSVSGPEEI